MTASVLRLAMPTLEPRAHVIRQIFPVRSVPGEESRIGQAVLAMLLFSCSSSVRKDIDRRVRGAAETIICGKGATYYGIGSALARIVKVILHDQRAVLTVGSPTADVAGVRNVTVSLPRLVGGQGVLETFPLPLADEEWTGLRDSARVIRQVLDELGDNI